MWTRAKARVSKVFLTMHELKEFEKLERLVVIPLRTGNWELQSCMQGVRAKKHESRHVVLTLSLGGVQESLPAPRRIEAIQVRGQELTVLRLGLARSMTEAAGP